MREIILEYEDFTIYKNEDGRYYVVNKGEEKEREVILIHRETDILLSDEKLFNSCSGYDYSGEEINSTDYLFHNFLCCGKVFV